MREPLTYLEGRPIYAGDTLYDKHGHAFTARPPDYRSLGYDLLMVMVTSRIAWSTNTHWLGHQVLFWTSPKPFKLAKNWPWG